MNSEKDKMCMKAIRRIQCDTESKQERGRDWEDFMKAVQKHFTRNTSTAPLRMDKRKENSEQSRGRRKEGRGLKEGGLRSHVESQKRVEETKVDRKAD